MTDLNRTALPSRTDGTVEKTDTLVVGAGQAGADDELSLIHI